MKTLTSLAILLLALAAGVTAQQANVTNAVVIAGLQAMGLFGTTYAAGDSPIWSTTTRRFQPSSTAGGVTTITASTCAAPGVRELGALTTGFAFTATPSVLTCITGAAITTTTAGSFALSTDTVALTIGAASDLSLNREGADHWFQRRTTTAQRASWAMTYASTSSYEAFSIDAQTVANSWLIGSRTAATGASRAVRLISQDANASNSFATLLINTAAPFIRAGYFTSTLTAVNLASTGNLFQIGEFTNTATSGSVVAVAITPTYNQAAASTANADLAIARIETSLGSGAQYFINMLAGAAGTTQRAAIDNTGKFTAYTSVATAGQGVDVVRAQATTGTVTNTGTASIATWTPGAADVEVEVGCRVNITVSTTHSFSCDVTYTDVANNARTRVLPMDAITGTPLATGLMTNVVGAGDFASDVLRIGVKASTAIVVRTSAGGTFTTVTYTASGTIKQVG